VLHSAYKKDNDTDNGKEFFKGVKIIRHIASQINHGKEFFEEDKELILEYSKLNMKAGKQALEGCDHKTAYLYLLTSLSLLPLDHWESHYDFSLRLHFLLADAANSSCQYDEADEKLQTIFEKARCLEDKLPSYLLQSQSECSIIIFLSQMSTRVNIFQFQAHRLIPLLQSFKHKVKRTMCTTYALQS